MYRDIVGQCTFEKFDHESLSEPENYTVLCPACKAEAKGRVRHRSLWAIVGHHKWVLLSGRNHDTLYCTIGCAKIHAPEQVASFVRGLLKKRAEIDSLYEAWSQ